MLFETLLNSVSLEPELQKEINNLLGKKKVIKELKKEPRINIISTFLEEKFAYFSDYVRKLSDNEK
jgi:predicted nucleotidyltransferase